MTKYGKAGVVHDMVRQHPRFVKMGVRIAWRNATNLIDYHLLNGRSFPPKAVTFRISGQCDLYCQMCNFRHAGFLDTSQMLPVSIFEKVIDEVGPYGLHVSLTGGEPLLHPDIVGCIRCAKERGLSCSLVTNGWRLARYAEELVGAGVDLLSVSVDGPEEIHDEIRNRKGLHRKILEGIREVGKFEKRPLLFFCTTIQADNHEHLDRIVDDAVQVGVDGVNIQHLQTRPPDRTARHNQKHPGYQVREGWIDQSLLQVDTTALQGTLDRAKQKGLFVNVFPVLSAREMLAWYADPLRLLNGRRIKCPWFMANVFHDGTMRMCDDIILGDLKEESFWDIWNGARMMEFRRVVRKRRIFSICATCCSLYRTRMI